MPPRSAASLRRRALPAVRLVATTGVVMLMAACGAADGEPTTETSTRSTNRVQVADARFDGDFQVTSLTAAGQDVEVISVPVITIETIFGGLTVKPGCNTYFGSFTLSEDGAASFTVAGGSKEPCEELGQQEAAVIDALGAVTSWRQTTDGFRFEGPDGNELTISR